MENFSIFTRSTECQDCYKCLRECPVKAIKIENNHAQVIEDDCIVCGHCIDVCPVSAKKVSSDLDKVKQLIANGDKVIVSLAPSYISEFKNIESSKIISALKRLGFYAVSETALGAEEVTAALISELDQYKNKIAISSACPTVVMYIKKYFPEYSQYVTNFLSPLIVHAKMLEQNFEEDIKIVFIGPCISKKIEIIHNNDLIDYGLTFQDLIEWFNEENIKPEDDEILEDQNFFPYNSKEGSVYPIEGGMINTIKVNCNYIEDNYMTFSGINNVKNALSNISHDQINDFLFLELLACEGGCINGPASSTRENTIQKRLDIINKKRFSLEENQRKPHLDISTQYNFNSVVKKEYPPELINEMLRTIGKFKMKDELNCDGCGYDSCRDFVNALIEKKAEKSMCVSYMRKLAQKKANSLIQSMPSGVVIVNKQGKIEECNKKFAEILGEDPLFLFNMKPGLEGAVLESILPEHYRLFSNFIENEAIHLTKTIKYSDKILNLTIFSIETGSIVGGIIQDITEPAVSREHIIKSAQDVIKKNVKTVQKIAYLLGENAAESEVMLNSIIDAYSKER